MSVTDERDVSRTTFRDDGSPRPTLQGSLFGLARRLRSLVTSAPPPRRGAIVITLDDDRP